MRSIFLAPVLSASRRSETSFGSFTKKRYRFCGKERDEESGLYYYGARYYATWTCRFVSVDPLAAKYPFYTPYQYAGNQPVNSVDLDGLEPDPSNSTSGQSSQSQQGGQHIGPAADTRSPEKRVPTEFVWRQEPKEVGPINEKDDFSQSVDKPKIENQSFAIYVAFPDKTAKIGTHDKSIQAQLIRQLIGANKELPVEHAGIIIGDGKTGKTYYYDFGRFDSGLYNSTGMGITRGPSSKEDFETIDAVFDKNGNVLNGQEIVSSLVERKGGVFL